MHDLFICYSPVLQFCIFNLRTSSNCDHHDLKVETTIFFRFIFFKCRVYYSLFFFCDKSYFYEAISFFIENMVS